MRKAMTAQRCGWWLKELGRVSLIIRNVHTSNVEVIASDFGPDQARIQGNVFGRLIRIRRLYEILPL